jgi:hypothetical protein
MSEQSDRLLASSPLHDLAKQAVEPARGTQPKDSLNRRRTDGDGSDALLAAHRAIAEHAYHLYLQGDCDRSRSADYWRLADEQAPVAKQATRQRGRNPSQSR